MRGASRDDRASMHRLARSRSPRARRAWTASPSLPSAPTSSWLDCSRAVRAAHEREARLAMLRLAHELEAFRSEERRVGKEGRSRSTTIHYIENNELRAVADAVLMDQQYAHSAAS